MQVPCGKRALRGTNGHAHASARIARLRTEGGRRAEHPTFSGMNARLVHALQGRGWRGVGRASRKEREDPS